MKKGNEGILYVIICIVCVIAIYLISSYINLFFDKKRQKEDQEYFSLVTRNKTYKGNITSCRISKVWNGTLLIEVSIDKLSLSGITKNNIYTHPDIRDFLQVGDSIYKPYNTDSIYVYKGDREYYFILGQIIEK